MYSSQAQDADISVRPQPDSRLSSTLCEFHYVIYMLIATSWTHVAPNSISARSNCKRQGQRASGSRPSIYIVLGRLRQKIKENIENCLEYLYTVYSTRTRQPGSTKPFMRGIAWRSLRAMPSSRYSDVDHHLHVVHRSIYPL